jgi:hypothetical protein
MGMSMPGRWLVTGLLCIAGTLAQAAEPAASPFDPMDPEVQFARSLKWKEASFDNLPAKSKCEALMALNRFLDMLAAKAESRADLLVAYLDAQNLGETYMAELANVPEATPMSYEDGKKLAAAYIATSQGSAKWSGEMEDASPEMLDRYLALYDKQCRRNYAAAVAARHEVRLMGAFLQNQGKMQDYLSWSKQEVTRREAEHKKMLAEKQSQKEAAEQERKRQEQEQAMKRMEYAFQLEKLRVEKGADSAVADNNNSGSGDYYYNDGWGYSSYWWDTAYRSAARQRVSNASNRWGSRPRPTPRRR